MLPVARRDQYPLGQGQQDPLIKVPTAAGRPTLPRVWPPFGHWAGPRGNDGPSPNAVPSAAELIAGTLIAGWVAASVALVTIARPVRAVVSARQTQESLCRMAWNPAGPGRAVAMVRRYGDRIRPPRSRGVRDGLSFAPRSNSRSPGLALVGSFLSGVRRDLVPQARTVSRELVGAAVGPSGHPRGRAGGARRLREHEGGMGIHLGEAATTERPRDDKGFISLGT